MMLKRLLFSSMFLALMSTSVAQGIFKRCDKKKYELSRPASWQRDTVHSRRYVCNCYHSTTYLVLYNDSTFQYKIDREGPGGYAEGKWCVNSRKKIVLRGRPTARKLISVHKGDYSLTYLLEDVDNMTFLTRGTALIQVRR